MKILFFFFLSLATASVSGQVEIQVPRPAPLVIIIPANNQTDTLKTDMRSLILNASKIQSISVLKGISATVAYGNEHKDGLIIIKTKEQFPLVRLKAILDKYNISKEDRKLRVCIDNKVVKNPELIIADLAEIEEVEISTERHLLSWETADNTEKFVNIRTYGSKPAAL